MVGSDVIRRRHKSNVVVKESIVVHVGRYGGGSGRCGRTKGVWNVRSLPSSVECGWDKDSSGFRFKRSVVLSSVCVMCARHKVKERW